MKHDIRTILLKKHKGVGLIELMLSFALVALLIVGVLQLARFLNDRMKISSTQTLLRMVSAGVEQFKSDVGRLPSKIDELITPPSDQNERRRWQGPYVGEKAIAEGMIKDPYGHEISYEVNPSSGSFEVKSWGKYEPGSDVGNIFPD